jgi:hypothetical protein
VPIRIRTCASTCAATLRAATSDRCRFIASGMQSPGHPPGLCSLQRAVLRASQLRCHARIRSKRGDQLFQ